MKILVIDYSGENILQSHIPSGHEIILEQSDGLNAYRIAGEWAPDIILVNGQSKPGHNRQTIQAIQRRKKTSRIPVYVVNTPDKDKADIGLFSKNISSSDISKVVRQKVKN
jgi:chemotaxis response regulator CheB